MSYLSTPLSQYQRNKNYLLTGQEEPQTGGHDQLDAAYPTLNRQAISTPHVPSAFSRRSPTIGAASQSTPTVGAPSQTQSQPSTPQTTSAPSTPAPAASTTATPGPVPTLPSYQRTGSLSERLFSPLTTGAQQGQQSLTEAANLFSQQAGPSRSYESTGAENTLRQAYQTGAEPAMEAARGYVGAQYTGPHGLDTNTTAGLQKLTEDLQARQRALGTGGGLETLIGQSVGGLTPGQALYEAQRQLPAARVEARDLGFQQVAPLTARLMQERKTAQDFAAQRAAEEADIAARSRGFLTGERGGISSEIQALMDERAAQQAAAEGAYGNILGQTPEGRLGALQAAAPYLEGGAATAERFNTPAVQANAEADALFNQIMADPRYASIAGYDPLELGVTRRGKAFYDLNGQDLRAAVEDPAVRQMLYQRQQELENAFDPARGQKRAFRHTPKEGGELAQYRPLYYGQGFEPVDPVNYLGFDPGVRPSRENTSTAVQKEQFNRINDLLGEMDRIAQAGESFRAAQIFADADKYLADEEAALEANKESLSAANEEWRRQVHKLRKAYRKAAREKQYAQIGQVIGGVAGGILGVGGGPLGVVAGAGTGSQIGGSIGKSLA